MQLKVKLRQIQNFWMKKLTKLFTGPASWTKGWSWMLVASGRMVVKKSEKYYWEYSFVQAWGALEDSWADTTQQTWSFSKGIYSSAFLRNVSFYLVLLQYRAKTKPGYFRHFKAAYPQTKTDAEILQYASEYNLVDNEYFFDRYESWWTTNNWFPMHITIPKNVNICELMSRHPPQKMTNCEIMSRHPR